MASYVAMNNDGLDVPLKSVPPLAPGKSQGPRTGTRASALQHVRGLPASFVHRLEADSQGGEHYRSIHSVGQVAVRQPNSSYFMTQLGAMCCMVTALVKDGELGQLQEDDKFEFLGPGYHCYGCCGVAYGGEQMATVVDIPVMNGTKGFLTVAEGSVGVLIVASSYRLLPPGTYEWASPLVRFESVCSIRDQIVRLGPYCLVTVPTGEVAITFYNGELRVLGIEGPTSDAAQRDADGVLQRTFFLDDPKWELKGFLTTVMQTDRLKGNDLLSMDNVEVVIVAMSQWRIADPIRAVNNCAPTMEEIREKVNQLIRATIARIVAGTRIGAGPVSGSVATPVVQGQAVGDGAAPPSSQKGKKKSEDTDLAYLMQSEQASRHMAEMNIQMALMGIEVTGVYVPEKRMKNDDIRKEVAKQAVIGIKADAERAAADATAYSTVKAARAQAEAVSVLAEAHAEAGRLLGAPESTSARLALSETLGKALQGANLTVFTGAPEKLPFMLTAPTQTGGMQ